MLKNLNNFFTENKIFNKTLFFYYLLIICCLCSYYCFLGFNINYILYYFWLLNVLLFIILKFCLKFGYFKQNSIILGYTLYDNFNKSNDPPLYTYIKDSYLISIFYFTVSTFIFILLYYYSINIFSINIMICSLIWIKLYIRVQLDSMTHSTYDAFTKYLNSLEKESIVLYADTPPSPKKGFKYGFFNWVTGTPRTPTPGTIGKALKAAGPIASICMACIWAFWVVNDFHKEINQDSGHSLVRDAYRAVSGNEPAAIENSGPKSNLTGSAVNDLYKEVKQKPSAMTKVLQSTYTIDKPVDSVPYNCTDPKAPKVPVFNDKEKN